MSQLTASSHLAQKDHHAVTRVDEWEGGYVYVVEREGHTSARQVYKTLRRADLQETAS